MIRKRLRGGRPTRKELDEEFDAPRRCLFAIELTKLLRANRVTQGELADVLTSEGHQIDRTVINRMASGVRIPLADLVDAIALIFKLDDNRRSKLHRAAAMDRGYRISSTEEL